MKGRLAAGGIAAALVIALPYVAKWEGLENLPYTDITGTRTVCFGETKGVEERYHSDAECLDKLRLSLGRHAAEADRCIPAEATPKTRAAFYIFAYNLGSGPLCDLRINPKTKRPFHSMALYLKAGNLPAACAKLSAYVYSRGVRLKGLENRRREERALCEEGLHAL